MPKGRLGNDAWYVWDDGSGRFFFAERGSGDSREEKYVSAHCLSCAKLKVVGNYGGRVDLRGRNNMCLAFLKVFVRIGEQEGTEDE